MQTCEIHWARLDQLNPHRPAPLDDVEIDRRDAYLREDDRARFTLGAVMLRVVVAARLRVAPENVRVDRTCEDCGQPHGRPRLPGAALHLSVTHSGDLAAVAVTAAGPVGVDVEAVRLFDHRPLLDEVLAPEEREGETSLDAFHTYWTRKESVLKAVGAGLKVPMRQLRVTPPTRPPRLLRYPGESVLEVQMADIALAPGCKGAVTVLGPAPVAFLQRNAGALLRG